jgi:hypothetical protein
MISWDHASDIITSSMPELYYWHPLLPAHVQQRFGGRRSFVSKASGTRNAGFSLSMETLIFFPSISISYVLSFLSITLYGPV